MGTKENPGQFDCYANALPDEPMFVLLARDPHFATLVSEWARQRCADIVSGVRPESDWPMVHEAQRCAVEGARWRKLNYDKWRA